MDAVGRWPGESRLTRPPSLTRRGSDLLGEDVVVAGGGVILPDDGRGVEGERAKIVDAAADALAIAAAGSLLAPDGPVVFNAAGGQGECRAGVIEQTAAQAVAAVTARTAGAADGLVVAERAAVGRGGAGHDAEGPAPAVAAVAAAAAVAALGQVAAEGVGDQRQRG